MSGSQARGGAAYVVSAAQAPIGQRVSALADAPAPTLGGMAIRAVKERASIPADAIDTVFRAPARQAVPSAGPPKLSRGTTIRPDVR